VIKNTVNAAGKINDFAKFLKEMTADEIKSLPKASQNKLEKALELVLKMSKAASENKNEG